MSDIVFEQVVYHISETLDVQKREQLSQVLDARGAQKAEDVTDPDLTHFITSSLPLEDFVEQLPPHSRAHTVTPLWVERSFVLGSQQDPEFFSADPAYLFSGVTATATDLSAADCELMSAAITAMGGQWRTALTRDVTHLFALAKGSAKYETAMHYREQMNVCVLVPHWFDDTVRLGIRDLPTRKYEWPEPAVFGQRLEGRTSQEDVDYEPTKERMMLYDTASMSADDHKKMRPAEGKVWEGKRILLGLSLDLSDRQRDALCVDIRRQGGIPIVLPSEKSTKAAGRVQEELAKMEETDIYVTRYRTGAAYAKAYKLEKTIGTLAWLWYVRASGKLSRPADQLLHYPIPDSPASGFEKEVVTVTNYTGKDREYLKKLITLMGGEFTASMSAEKNSIVVAAYLQGTKTDKAASWSIPIVNHTWYILFPPGVDFSVVLAQRGLGKIAWEPGQLEEMEAEVEAEEEAMDTSPRKRTNTKTPTTSPRKQKNHKARDDLRPVGTLQSVGEVEDAIAMDEGADMDVDPDHSAMDRKLVRRVSRKPENDSEEQRPTTPDTSPKRPSRTNEAAQAAPADSDLESPTTSRKLQTARRKVLPRDEESSAEEEVPKTKSKARAKPAAPAPSTENKEQRLRLGLPDDLRSVLGDLLSNNKGKAREKPAPKKRDADPAVADGHDSLPYAAKRQKRRHPRLSRWDLRRPHRKRQPSNTGPRKIKKTAALEAEKEHGDHASTTESPYKVGRTPRGAATKAAQKLHDVVMPDVLSYQKEVKSGTVRATHERDGGASTSLPAKGKKRPSMGSAGPESEEEDEIAQPEKKKRKAAASKKLLAEDQFAVKDGDTEKKYDFKLTDALKFAKKNAGKLFKGMTFYVTPKVPVETKLLKNVVTANGGTLSTQSPTVRILDGHDNRFVISSPGDVSIWRPLVKHHPIYNQELILTSALKQEIDWDQATFRVPGSS
ncbi:uncharacterized protein BXZ73DRAFT_106335 [Epithele typhae]|uniref:uncharacterized protein n=1 Tax=Epithele typhae TaxID=378194 RepID=UPI002007E427|nr:uncharacterized protein BXZ73DRAFT_106335 [Epithele typhae]KAH9915024.1 hypothetical protein BXZ73DRAFT_106335 [Epithele typhae]